MIIAIDSADPRQASYNKKLIHLVYNADEHFMNTGPLPCSSKPVFRYRLGLRGGFKDDYDVRKCDPSKVEVKDRARNKILQVKLGHSAHWHKNLYSAGWKQPGSDWGHKAWYYVR